MNVVFFFVKCMNRNISKLRINDKNRILFMKSDHIYRLKLNFVCSYYELVLKKK